MKLPAIMYTVRQITRRIDRSAQLQLARRAPKTADELELYETTWQPSVTAGILTLEITDPELAKQFELGQVLWLKLESER
jgi:hypothetical protein